MTNCYYACVTSIKIYNAYNARYLLVFAVKNLFLLAVSICNAPLGLSSQTDCFQYFGTFVYIECEISMSMKLKSDNKISLNIEHLTMALVEHGFKARGSIFLLFSHQTLHVAEACHFW